MTRVKLLNAGANKYRPHRQKMYLRTAKIQISLRMRTFGSESSLCAFWIAKADAKLLHADNEDSDQTAWMRRLIRVFVGCTRQKVRFLT